METVQILQSQNLIQY